MGEGMKWIWWGVSGCASAAEMASCKGLADSGGADDAELVSTLYVLSTRLTAGRWIWRA